MTNDEAYAAGILNRALDPSSQPEAIRDFLRAEERLVADATAVPLDVEFDVALCLTNTWGTMSDKLAVLGEMRRLAPKPGSRILTVFAPPSE